MRLNFVDLHFTKQIKERMSKIERAKFGSKLGVILATAGSAVGLGNVWRFPYMAGENGGAVFILIYIGCVLALGIPCMVSEFIIGREAQANTARAYRSLAGGRPWAIVGYLSVLTGFLIMGYYTVVSGWCLEYIFASAGNSLSGDSDSIRQYFQAFSTNLVKPVVWTVLIILVTHIVVVRGVRSGIERASRVMMPMLFILLLVIVGASLMLPGAEKGVAFLFNPDFSKLNSDVFLGALGQAFYSMSIGMGCLCTYASYFSRQTNLAQSAVQIGVIDFLVAILAGLMIFPAAFSVGVSPDSGPSLVFITIPGVMNNAFAAIPVVGYVISLLFYGLLTLAALTSLISLHEVCTAFLSEEMHIQRRTAAVAVTAGCSLVGAFCSLSLGGYEGLQLFGWSLFDVFDFVTGQIFLPVAGFFTCLFVGWYLPHRLVHNQYTNWGVLRTRTFHLYLLCIKYLCPICILLIFLNQLGLI